MLQLPTKIMLQQCSKLRLKGIRSRRLVLILSLIVLVSFGMLATPISAQLDSSHMNGSQVDLAGLATTDGGGIKVRDARRNVLFGSPRRSKTPAVVDYKKALAATPEARKIRADGIDKNSAEYAILKQKAVKRLKKVIQSLAVQEGRDCVVKKGSIRSKGGAQVADLTALVVSEMESADLD